MGHTLRLKEIRKARGMTQGELAKAVGVSDRVLGAWERGETQLPLEDAVNICFVLDCTPNDLCGWYESHPEDRPAAPAAPAVPPAYADLGQRRLNDLYEQMSDEGRENAVGTVAALLGVEKARVQGGAQGRCSEGVA